MRTIMSFLSEDEMEKIHKAGLEILEKQVSRLAVKKYVNFLPVTGRKLTEVLSGCLSLWWNSR